MEYTKIYSWIDSCLSTTYERLFISSKDLDQSFCTYSNVKVKEEEMKSFGILFAKAIADKKLVIKKGKLNNIRGYFYLDMSSPSSTNAPKIKPIKNVPFGISTSRTSTSTSLVNKKLIDQIKILEVIIGTCRQEVQDAILKISELETKFKKNL
jgi:hypothetical protein